MQTPQQGKGRLWNEFVVWLADVRVKRESRLICAQYKMFSVIIILTEGFCGISPYISTIKFMTKV
jgi:hypothetical protein